MNRSEVRRARRHLHGDRFALPADDPELLAAARTTGDSDLVGEVLITLGACAFLRGDIFLCDHYLTEADAVLNNAATDRWSGPEAALPAILSLTRGLLAMRRGERAQAGDLLMHAFDQAIEASDRKLAAFVWSNLAALEAAKGYIIPATALYHRLLTWPTGLGRLHGGPRLGLARIAMIDGDHQNARSNVTAALASDHTSVPWWRAYGRVMLATVELAEHRFAEAAHALEDPALDAPGGHGEAKDVLQLRLAIARGEFDLASALAADLQSDLDAPLNRIKLPAVRIAQADLAARLGRTAEALELLRDADTPSATYEARLLIAIERERLFSANGDDRLAAEQLQLLRRVRALSRHQVLPSLDAHGVATPHGDAGDGNPVEVQVVVGALEPAYERMRALELEDLLNQRRELVGVVAHDLRGALATCRLAEPMLTEKLAPPDERRTGAAALANAVDDMCSIVDVLGQLLSIGADGGLVETRVADVGQIVATAVASVAPIAEAKGQTIRLIDELDPERDATGDRGVVAVVVANMLSNAIKYSPQGAPIDVRVGHKVDSFGTWWTTVAVRDSGQGMTEEDLGVAWQRYTRASGSPTDRETSLGLGLYIAKELSERIGARVKAESEGAGAGSTFTLELLANQTEDALMLAPVSQRSLPGTRPWLDAPRVVLPA